MALPAAGALNDLEQPIPAVREWQLVEGVGGALSEPTAGDGRGGLGGRQGALEGNRRDEDFDLADRSLPRRASRSALPSRGFRRPARSSSHR